jgi:NDP-sugar pyrophosphorylase family protein
MDAVVLCGGRGTRLQAVAPGRQKTMLSVRGKPFLDRVIGWAAKQGLSRFVLCTGYRDDEVRGFYESSPRPGVEIVFSQESSPLGTGGALGACRGLLKGGPVLAMNGDSLCEIDLAAFADFHKSRGGAASVAVIPPGSREDGGFLEIAPDGRVSLFREREPGPGRMLNAGIYILDPGFWDFIGPGASSIEKDVFPRALRRGVYAFPAGAPHYDIGTPQRLAAFAETM